MGNVVLINELLVKSIIIKYLRKLLKIKCNVNN